MLKLGNVEFYISHACNLACDNCNHFNNFAFKGHMNWNDHSSDYDKWSRILAVENISIIGGEPTLNPNILEWMRGIRSLWPKAGIEITTNGTRLKHSPYILQACRDLKIKLKISIHGSQLAALLWKDIEQITCKPLDVEYVWRDYHLISWKDTYEKIRADGWPDCQHPDDFQFLPTTIANECESKFGFSYNLWRDNRATRYITDADGLRLEVNWYDQFHESAVIHDKVNDKLILHDSDPDRAVEICQIKWCHKFHRGKLYKCGVIANLPEFIRQFEVDIDRQAVELIDAYIPASHDWSYEKLSEFIQGLDEGKSIPQCRFCPSAHNHQTISNVTKKPKLRSRLDRDHGTLLPER